MSRDKKNTGTECTVKGGREAALKKVFLICRALLIENILLRFVGFGFHENLKYTEVCSHLELFPWRHAESLLKDGSSD